MNIDRPTRNMRLPWKKRSHQQPSAAESTVSRRVPFLNFLPTAIKGHVVASAGEFVGTFLFLLFAFGGTNVVNTAPAVGANATDLQANPAKLLYISLCFGMSLAVNAWVFFRISGGLFNPAVTIGMMLIGATTYIRGALIIIAQLLGGIAAAALVSAMFPGPLNVRTTLSTGTSVVQGLFIEMFLTAQLVFTIFMLAAEKHEGTFIAPVGIGLSLFIAELMGVYYTGGSLNPARSFGPCVVVHQFAHYHWIYWVGPILGALLASAFYYFIKALEYETVNAEPDPREIVGKDFDPETGHEMLFTRGGDVIEEHNSMGGRTLATPNGNANANANANSNANNINSNYNSPNNNNNNYSNVGSGYNNANNNANYNANYNANNNANNNYTQNPALVHERVTRNGDNRYSGAQDLESQPGNHADHVRDMQYGRPLA